MRRNFLKIVFCIEFLMIMQLSYALLRKMRIWRVEEPSYSNVPVCRYCLPVCCTPRFLYELHFQTFEEAYFLTELSLFRF